MNTKILSLFFCAFLFAPAFLHAQESDPFKKYNPDGRKFEFAKSYIISLGYLRGVETRWKKADEIKKKDGEAKFIGWNIERLIMENMDIRIAKNYITKYAGVNNAMMRKVIDSHVLLCDQLVELNRQEREKWEEFKGLKDSGDFDVEKDQKFVKIQEDFAVKRKEPMRGIVENSILMTKVLLDDDTKEKQVKKRLAVTSKERDKLVLKLDAFAKDNYDWGMKEGQTYLQAAEASIREVLEDPAYLSVDE